MDYFYYPMTREKVLLLSLVKIRPSIGTDDHHICGTFAQTRGL